MEYNWHKKIIVIVEDIEINYILLKKQMRNTGAEIIWLKNGTEIIDYVKANKKLDLILMDVRMPIMNGIEATKILKKIKPSIPIIMQTACVMGNDCEDIEDSGCDDYIYKPIIAEKLLMKIDKLI